MLEKEIIERELVDDKGISQLKLEFDGDAKAIRAWSPGMPFPSFRLRQTIMGKVMVFDTPAFPDGVPKEVFEFFDVRNPHEVDPRKPLKEESWGDFMRVMFGAPRKEDLPDPKPEPIPQPRLSIRKGLK